MSCKISRRSFLKVSGCLMLGSAVSGLLCGAGDPAEGGAAVPTVGGLRVNYVRAFAKDYGNNFRQMEIHLNIENTNSSAAYFNQENFVPMLGNSRYGGAFTFTGLSKWNGSRYVQDVQLKAGETQTISYSCKLQTEDLSAGLRTVDPAPWSLTLLYGGQRQTFTGYLLPDHYSTEYTAGPVESTVLPSVGGIVLSGFWSSDFLTQVPSYSLPIYFTMQNSNDTAAQLPFRGVAENGDVLDNFTIRMDGQPRNHYRLYACTHTSRFTPEEKGHLETLQPQEICFAETGISLTKDEYSTLYTTGHTLEITFSYGDESVTVRGNTRTGIFEAI